MKSADLRRLEDLYNAAMELPALERGGYVAAACAEDPDLRRRLERMVADAGEAAEFMETPVLPPAAADAPGGNDPLIGSHVGRYLLLRVIGVGGMGVVYEAQQDSPSRRVALKLLRPGWVSRSLLRRFEHEAEVLGRLSHPGIAQIHEAGSVEIRGVPQPFFAMELVDGRPITRYAAEQNLSARQRQELMTRVCEAVEHAHQKGVIHRDLKPGNILVDNSGQPKVLDFGVARATDADIAATTLRTHAGQIVGTIAYMSPEQARGKAADLDTRSDVYSLGVLLFELLAGRLPHDIADKSIPEAVRAITEDDPSHLSTIDRSLRGDVETIVAKALERDKDRRYQSAADLAADLRRHLSDEPIMARPASTFYQVSKFAKRNKGLVGGVVAAFVVLTAALIGVSVQAAKIQRGKVRAEELASFMEAVLGAADPFPSTIGASVPQHFGGNARVVDVLDESLKRLEGQGFRDPLVEAKIRQKMSMSCFGIARFADGEANARRALEILRSLVKADDPLVLATKIGLAYNLTMLMESREAERLANEAVTGCVRVYGEHHEETLRALQCLWLCSLYLNYQGDCAALLERMLEIVNTSPRDLDYAAFSIKAQLAANMVASGRAKEGRALAQEALEEGLAKGAERTHWVAYTRAVLARAAAALRDTPEAVAQSLRGAEIWTAASGEAGALEFRAESGVYLGIGTPIPPRGRDEGEKEYLERRSEGIKANAVPRERGLKVLADAAAKAREHHGPDSPATARIILLHANRLWDWRQLERAEEQFLAYFATLDRAGIAETQEMVRVRYTFASVLLGQAAKAKGDAKQQSDQGQTQEAQALLGRAESKTQDAIASLREGIRIAEGFTRQEWKRHRWDDRLLYMELAQLLHGQGRDAEVAPLVALVAERIDEPSDPEDANSIAWWLFEFGRPDLSEPIARRAAGDWRTLRGRGEGPYTRPFVYTLDTWASALRALGRLEEAEAVWGEADAVRSAAPNEVSGYDQIVFRYAECLAALKKYEQAEAILLRTLAELRDVTWTEPEALRAAATATARMYEEWGKPEKAAEYRPAKQ